jgi:hypothetical protein
VTIARETAPGAIGAQQRPQAGSCPEEWLVDRVQPVSIQGPKGMLVAVETAYGWSPLQPAPVRTGLVVGQPYRLRIAGIQGYEERELFPSVRILARLASPPGMDWRFPVEVVLDASDLTEALAGAHVRRIVYAACEPDMPDIQSSNWFDVRPGEMVGIIAGQSIGEPTTQLTLNIRPDTGCSPLQLRILVCRGGETVRECQARLRRLTGCACPTLCKLVARTLS